MMLVTVFCPHNVVSSSSGQSDSSGSAAAIGGAVGGTILFVVITALLIMILWCVRLSQRKKSHSIDDSCLKENASNVVELGSNTAAVEVELDSVQTNESVSDPGMHSKGIIKMTANPSYDSTTKFNMNIKITTNPSYDSTNNPVCAQGYDNVFDHSIQCPKGNSTTKQDLPHCDTSPDLAIKIEANPSYGLIVQDVNTDKVGVKNDYDYIANGVIQHPSHLTVNTDQAAAESKEVEYGVVNQPMSDSFSPATLERMIRGDKGNGGNWPVSEDATKYEYDNNDT